MRWGESQLNKVFEGHEGIVVSSYKVLVYGDPRGNMW